MPEIEYTTFFSLSQQMRNNEGKSTKWTKTNMPWDLENPYFQTNRHIKFNVEMFLIQKLREMPTTELDMFPYDSEQHEIEIHLDD